MKALVLASHTACNRRDPSLSQVLDYLRVLGVQFEFHSPESVSELRGVARQAAARGYECVAAAGGDGTAHHVLQGLVGSDTALGLLPLGNGNDLALSLGIPADPFLACRVLVAGATRRIDLARVTGPVSAHYACVGSVGFDAAVQRQANAHRDFFRGSMLYIASAIGVLVCYRPIHIELASDGGDFTGEAMFSAVANSANYGGGLRIAPDARLDDGWLDITVVERMSKLDLLDTLPQLLVGTHVKNRAVRCWRARAVQLRAPLGEDFFCDGEYLARLPLEVRVARNALRVVAPAP